jgi:long-chain fatty acid transport protein
MCARNLVIISTALGVVPMTGSALGIRLFDHDAFATARGHAFVATADNPSAIYYNPAGIAQKEGHNTRAAFSLLAVDADYKGGVSRRASLEDAWVLLPGFFYSYSPTNSPLSVGIGYYLPFGLSMEWPDDGPFRTAAIEGELRYHTVNPVIAWQVTDTLAVAGGPTLNYARVDFRRGITSSTDELRFDGDGYAFGMSAGLLWRPLERHSFGLSYRTRTTMELEGRTAVEPASYGIPRQNASAELPFPHVIIIGYSFRPTPGWNFEVNLDWTEGERVKSPMIEQATGDVPLALNWDSGYAIEAGATRYFANGLHVSGGYAYVETSIPDKWFTPLVPNEDLHVFSAGVGGQYKEFTWDATYQFTYGPRHGSSGSVHGPAVSGDYSLIAHEFSLSFGYSF